MRIVSGIQPSGKLHLGNYFAMIEPTIALQEKGETFIFIADYHSLTSNPKPEILRQNVYDCALDFLACGYDPVRGIFFCQSDVPEVTELTWILSSLTPMGLLERCHSYKEKTARGISPNHALFAYPVLMAADILLYEGNLVPVGKDQKQHIEVTRDIAHKLNQHYGKELLTVPEAAIQESTAVIPGIDGQKMSKSYDNYIPLFAPEKVIRKRTMGIVTDSTPVEVPKPTENSLILQLYSLTASPEEFGAMEEDFIQGGVGYGELKKRLFTSIWNYFLPMRERRLALEKDPDYVKDILSEGKKKAKATARNTLEKIRQEVGLA